MSNYYFYTLTQTLQVIFVIIINLLKLYIGYIYNINNNNLSSLGYAAKISGILFLRWLQKCDT